MESSKHLIFLIVDDNPYHIHEVEIMISTYYPGSKFVCAPTKTDAMRILKQTPKIDILIADLDIDAGDDERPMRGMFGLSLVKDVHEKIPSIAYTIHNSEEIRNFLSLIKVPLVIKYPGSSASSEMLHNAIEKLLQDLKM